MTTVVARGAGGGGALPPSESSSVEVLESLLLLESSDSEVEEDCSESDGGLCASSCAEVGDFVVGIGVAQLSIFIFVRLIGHILAFFQIGVS